LDQRDNPTRDAALKDEDEASSYIGKEFFGSMSNIHQQQQEQIMMMYDIQGRRDNQLFKNLFESKTFSKVNFFTSFNG
jgi:hypothetical protein